MRSSYLRMALSAGGSKSSRIRSCCFHMAVSAFGSSGASKSSSASIVESEFFASSSVTRPQRCASNDTGIQRGGAVHPRQFWLPAYKFALCKSKIRRTGFFHRVDFVRFARLGTEWPGGSNDLIAVKLWVYAASIYVCRRSMEPSDGT